VFEEVDVRLQRFSLREFIWARVVVDEASELFDGKHDNYARRIRALSRDFTWYVSATFPLTPANMQGAMQLLQVTVGNQLVSELEAAYSRRPRAWRPCLGSDGEEVVRGSLYYTAFGASLVRVFDRFLRSRTTKQDIRNKDPENRLFPTMSKCIVIAPRTSLEVLLGNEPSNGDVLAAFRIKVDLEMQSLKTMVGHGPDAAQSDIRKAAIVHRLDIICILLRAFHAQLGESLWNPCAGKWMTKQPRGEGGAYVHPPAPNYCGICTWSASWIDIGKPSICLRHPYPQDADEDSTIVLIAADGMNWTLRLQGVRFTSRTCDRAAIFEFGQQDEVAERLLYAGVVAAAYGPEVEHQRQRLLATHDKVDSFVATTAQHRHITLRAGARNGTMLSIIRDILDTSPQHRILVFTTSPERLASFLYWMEHVMPDQTILQGGRDIRSKTRALVRFNADGMAVDKPTEVEASASASASASSAAAASSSESELKAAAAAASIATLSSETARILCFTKDQGASGANIIVTSHLILLDTEDRSTPAGRAQAELNEQQIFGRFDRITQTKHVQAIRILLDEPTQLKEFADSV